jgi:hypothetical protein
MNLLLGFEMSRASNYDVSLPKGSSSAACSYSIGQGRIIFSGTSMSDIGTEVPHCLPDGLFSTCRSDASWGQQKELRHRNNDEQDK